MDQLSSNYDSQWKPQKVWNPFNNLLQNHKDSVCHNTMQESSQRDSNAGLNDPDFGQITLVLGEDTPNVLQIDYALFSKLTLAKLCIRTSSETPAPIKTTSSYVNNIVLFQQNDHLSV